MAELKHDWSKIRKEYNEQVIGNNVSLKAFAEEQNISYSYMRKQAAQWQQDREIANSEFILAAEEDTRCADTMPIVDRNMFHIRAYDKALEHCMTILNDPMTHLCTVNGEFKPANLERVVATIEKCQKGQRLALGLDNQTKDSKSLLGDITDAITQARAEYGDDVEDEV